jgi:small subunit ribosomal protein S18
MNKKPMRTIRKIQVPKECYFCAEKKTPWYTDIPSLSKFTNDRGRIIPRGRNGLCALHQRRMTTAIKYARHLALMPFVVSE